ncbi:uncharacterized protein LOC144118560 [Amblyomma americanum]
MSRNPPPVLSDTGEASRLSRLFSESASRASRASRSAARAVGRSIATEMTVALSEATVSRRPFYPTETEVEAEPRSPATFSWDASLLAASASVFWVLLDVLVKLNPSIPTPKLLFHVSVGVFAGSMSLMSGVAEPYGPLPMQPLLFMRSVGVSGSLFARIFSLRFLTVVDAFTVSSLGPVLSAVPTCVTREGATVGRVLPLCMGALALALLGYVNGSATDVTAARRFMAGCVLTLTASVLRATVRQFNDAVSDVPSVVQAFHFSFVSLIVSCVLVVMFDSMKHLYDDIDMGTMVLLAQVSFAYIFSLTKARNLVNYYVVNVFLYVLDAFLSMAASHFVLEEGPGLYSYCAALLVMAAVVIVEVCRVGQLHLDFCRRHSWWNLLNAPIVPRPRPPPFRGMARAST